MTYARRYETFEVRRMLQEAEGVGSPLTGAGAHSRALHALKTPGGTGVSPGDMMQRTHRLGGESTGQFRNRGGTTQTSAFANLIRQADAASQALNSDRGQRGLAILDAPAHASKQLRLTLSIAGIHEAGFLGGGRGA